MAANNNPISPVAPTALAWATSSILTANVALTGLGTPDTDIKLIMTAGGTNAAGSRVNRIRVCHKGSNVATVMRIFLNNGLTNSTAANNTLIAEQAIPLNTLSQIAAAPIYDIGINCVMYQGYRLYYTIGTSVAAGFAVTCPDAGDY